MGRPVAVSPLQSVAGTGVTVEMLVVFAIVLLALVLFTTEPVAIDVTAILVMVLLIVLEPWTQISLEEGISGFSNPATITVLAMLILSAGISRTGMVQILGRKISNFAGDDLQRQLLATVGVTGPVSGFINNTPVVAVLVPVISDVANNGNTSPSKLLLPLSYASQMGGMLTLIGTSTNLLASDIARRLSGTYPSLHELSMFEFTKLGVIVLLVGSIYLLTVGHRLLPERVPPEEDYIAEYGIREYLTEVRVREGSPLVGRTVDAAIDTATFDADVLQVIRDGEQFVEPLAQKEVHTGDVLLLRTDADTLRQLARLDHLSMMGHLDTDAELEPAPETEQTIVEVVLPRESSLVGATLRTAAFRQRYEANVLAVRSRGEIIRERLDDLTFRTGDTLLVQAATDSIDRLARTGDFILSQEASRPEYRTEKIPHAVAIMLGVVGFAALPWEALAGATGVAPLAALQQDILVTALAGVVAMVLTGVLHANELYDAVEWNVIFLLAGVIPLGIALEQTGAAQLLGAAVATTGEFLPAIAVLWVFYVATGLVTEVISNNASVVLMIPVAAAAASAIGANVFAFVLAVMFAASTSFLGPVGYQTNLFVYGPGGYRFTDYIRVGLPLQLILSVVTVAGIAFFWGV
ncbi:SLC13 family permease [Halorientalis brevis]|uniref:SLC13 family permease n=1 Tax=Halorientalis brevis TaxID=1126241 RepID=A0ABD6CDN1_9EURY|nr:SLC13 family permease [Halorientalis brevis]